MQPRIEHPVRIFPAAMDALNALAKSSEEAGLPAPLVPMVHLRASQINGCSVCVEMHWRELARADGTDKRAIMVAAWREAPYFTDAERAALALTEATTRLADRPDPVPDEIWEEAAKHYDERELAALLLAIANINVWNRLNAATRHPAGRLPV
ncbi:carboxymuconolactone decarboxylase family protein [Pseudonocardia acaciae]|uniref:carboxymuconolactone decarboxylase family protein n=1 Tax=Pseudonocardia acaciae TaxID=551276 RepID=UPI00048CB33D|nr:carboxymuconolactone decarboxylase family protein [Pseudonocardia acaciae]